MPKYVKWEVASKSQNEYNIGNKKYSFGKQGISTVDIIIIVIASIAIIFSGVILYNNITTLNQVKSDIDNLQQTVESKQETIKRLAELGDGEKELKDKYEKNQLYIPSSKKGEQIMSDIDSIINNSGAKFVNLQYSAEVPMNDGIVDVPFVLKVHGTYEQINEILDNLYLTDRLYIVDSINSIKADKNSELINTDITMHAYYKPN